MESGGWEERGARRLMTLAASLCPMGWQCLWPYKATAPVGQPLPDSSRSPGSGNLSLPCPCGPQGGNSFCSSQIFSTIRGSLEAETSKAHCINPPPPSTSDLWHTLLLWGALTSLHPPSPRYGRSWPWGSVIQSIPAKPEGIDPWQLLSCLSLCEELTIGLGIAHRGGTSE